MKNKCYECKHRKDIMGDAHSSCNHPKALQEMMLSAMGPVADAIPGRMNVRANTHGSKMGWFAWPFNFDPVWLENCDGFEPLK